ncbi:phosphotransferase [Streptomyces sp. 900105755]
MRLVFSFSAVRSGSSFVFENLHGVSSTAYSLVFATNAAAMLAAGACFARLAGRGTRLNTLLSPGVGTALLGALAQVLLVTTVGETLAGTWTTLFVTAGGIGLVFPSAMSIGQAVGRTAPGAASALLGGFQFLFGALAAPLVGVFGEDSSRPMALIMLGALAAAGLALAVLARPWEGHGEPVPAVQRARFLRTLVCGPARTPGCVQVSRDTVGFLSDGSGLGFAGGALLVGRTLAVLTALTRAAHDPSGGSRDRPTWPSRDSFRPPGAPGRRRRVLAVTGHRMPAAEVPVSVDLVRRLLDEQHPDLAHLPIGVLANGWDNLVCRLGQEFLVRLPRRALAAELVAHEQRWLPELAGRLPLPVPAPVRVGQPTAEYPWAWSVVSFLPGLIAARSEPDDPWSAATTLGGFLDALHVPAPSQAPVNSFRGIPLAGRAEGVLTGLAHVDQADRATALQIWETAAAAPAWDGPPVWLHGDLHPANILVDRGRISAVIDFGDITSGDPAADLSMAWMLFTPEQRAALRQAYGRADDATWERARGWALALSLVFLSHSADNPLMRGIGERALRSVLE